MLRTVIFLLGVLLMALSVLAPFVADEARMGRFRLFELGLLLAVAAHGLPEGLR